MASAGAGSAAAPAKRLIITRMVLENFKSYAGVQNIGPFHHSFSSVVGPNGSGKSNVIDAMLFVFGKRAKQLRLNKVSELIHNSEHHQNLEYARVSVFFDEIVDGPGETFSSVPNSNFEVTRVAYRDNSSKYTVDGRTKTFTEVTDFLKEKGIDLDHNRFLILQGEVEQISLMKPKGVTAHETGLLEYLEDIIGSNKYIEDIEKMTAQVEQLNDERSIKVQRTKMADREREGLVGARTDAETFLVQQHRLRQLKAILFQQQGKHASKAVVNAQDLVANLDAKRIAEKEKLATATKDAKALDDEHVQLKSDYEALCTALEEHKSAFAVLERKDVQARERMKSLKEKEKKLAQSVQKESEKAAEATATVNKIKADDAAASSKLPGLKATLEKEQKMLDAVYDALQGETAELRAKLEAAQKKFVPFATQIAAAQGEVDVDQSEINLLQKKLEDLLKKVTAAEAAMAQDQKDAEEKRKSVSTASARAKSIRSQAQAARAEATQAEAETKVLSKKAADLSHRVEDGKSSQSSESGNSVVQALLGAKARGKLAGIFGRLGDLGTIDDRYDVAVSTAVPQLNHIVVDTAENAQKAVAYLRANQAGVATFIILEKIGDLATTAAQTKAQLPAGSIRLFDLVNLREPKYAPAFYHAMRDTLVSDSLESAKKLAFSSGPRRNRVVTLVGEVIDIAGTMSGGGKTVARGGMKASRPGSSVGDVDVATLRAWEKELKETRDQITKLRAMVDSLESKAKSLDKEAQAVDDSVPQLQIEAEAAERAAQDTAKALPLLKKQAALSAEDEKARAALEKSLQSKVAKLAEAKKAATSCEKEVQDCKDAIDAVGGSRLKLQKVRVDTAAAAVEEAESIVAKASAQIKSSERAAEKAVAAAASATKQLELIAAELAEVKADVDDIMKKAAESMTDCEAAQVLVDKRRAALQACEAAYDKMRGGLSLLRQSELDLTAKWEESARALQEAKRRCDLQAESLKKVREEARIEAASLLTDGIDLSELLAAAVATKEEEVVDEEDKSRGKKAPTKKMALANVPTAILNDALTVDFDEATLATLDAAGIEHEVVILGESVDTCEESLDLGAIARWRAAEAEYRVKLADLDETTARRDVARAANDDLRKARLDEFMSGFGIISMRLKEMYQMITLGGDAELELVDSLDPFSEGVVFSVRPPKKSWKNISNLSGGEKTLSSLALVFALHYFKPTPLYVMDEIDAALDFQNVSIVANYIRERTKDAQFIIISLRNNMFELADRLVGIYKTHHCTKSVTINPAEMAASLQQPPAVAAAAP